MMRICLSAFKIFGLEKTLETGGTAFIPNNDLIGKLYILGKKISFINPADLLNNIENVLLEEKDWEFKNLRITAVM